MVETRTTGGIFLHQKDVKWCNNVEDNFDMPTPRGRTKRLKTPSALRASVSFPPELYRILEDLAKQKKVSIAWVVREAAEKYVADQWPLFGGPR